MPPHVHADRSAVPLSAAATRLAAAALAAVMRVVTCASLLMAAHLLVAAPAGAQPLLAAVSPGAPAVRGALARDLRDGRILHGRSRHRVLHFTFDDGPRLETTPRLLEHLDRAGTRATFFLVARQLDTRTARGQAQVELVRDMARRGHRIGLHGLDHTSLLELGEGEVEGQLDAGEALFADALGARPWLFRPPYGRHDDKSDHVLAGRRYTQVLWSMNAESPRVRTPEGVRDLFVASLLRRERTSRPGAIVLLHDTHPWVVDALPLIVRAIEERNCELLARGEELWDVADGLDLFFEPADPDDPSARAGTHGFSRVELDARQARLRAALRPRCAPVAAP